MAKTRRKYKGNATPATISAGLAAGAVSATISVNTGWPTSGPFYCVVDPGTSAEEKILIGSISGTTISSITRGVDDTSDQNHASGCTIYPVFTAIDADEANELTAKYTTRGDIVYQGASTFERLGVGAADYVLKTNGTDPSWGQVGTNGIADDAITAAKIAAGAVGASEIANGTVGVDELATAVINKLVPVGTIAMYGGATAPTGWLLCNGDAIDAGYTSLIAIVGANTPDLKGRFAIGDNSTLTLLGTGGSATITTSNLPAHTHANTATASTTVSISDPGHAHTIDNLTDTDPNLPDTSAIITTGPFYTSSDTVNSNTTGITATASTTVTMSNASVGSGTDYYPPYLVVNYIIKHD
jgi:microcystin-dependent protein